MTEAFSPTLASADFAASLQYDAIPAPVVDRIKRDLLDWIGCSIAGSIDPASKPIRAIDALMGGPKQAGVFGAPKMTDMRSAAMMNAYYSHIMEMDDVDRASISHPASCIFPAVLALAGETAKSASGKEMLASVVAGVSFEKLKTMLDNGKDVRPALLRLIPNTAISLRESVTFIASDGASESQLNAVVTLFKELGQTVVVSEAMMAAGTSLASCGIAFALKYLGDSIKGGVELGFDETQSREIVMQTMRGALALLQANGTMPQTEIDKVTTPGGLTLKGLDAMAEGGFSEAVRAGLLKSR